MLALHNAVAKRAPLEVSLAVLTTAPPHLRSQPHSELHSPRPS